MVLKYEVSSIVLVGASILANKTLLFWAQFFEKNNYCSGHNFVEKLKVECFRVGLNCFEWLGYYSWFGDKYEVFC